MFAIDAQPNKKDGLVELEQLMNEFFDGRTGNEKRQEIESLLTNFSNQRNSWKLCADYLAHTESQYVSMFCLTTIENVINKQWMCLPWEEKAQIKSLMYAYILEKHGTQSSCIRSKSVKLVVDIARLDWPHFYPDFFINILSLLHKSETRQLGLLFLLTTSEELIAPREDLSVDRKAELKKLLLAQMPQVFSILLEFLSNEHVLMNLQDCSLLLRVFTHLFSWVPASQVPNGVITILFKLAAKTDNQEISFLAMCTLNEMLYRHWVPPNWDQIVYHTMNLLQVLLNLSLDTLGSQYLEKVSDFLRLVIGMELSHTDEKPQNNIDALLAATLNFTIQQPTLDPGFLTCLDIWSHVLEIPTSKKYSGAFVSLAQQILNKIQFRQNRNELLDFDDSAKDDDGETEWKKFLKPCIEILAKIADFEPLEILRLVFEQWVELCGLYGQVCSNVPLAVQDVSTLHSLLRDLSSFTQIMGRLYPQCTTVSVDDEPQFTIARFTINHLLTLNELANKINYHSITDSIKLDFQKVHGEVLASLKSWCYWLPILHNNSSTKQLLNELVTNILNGCIPLLNPDSPVVLQHCSAHLISTITSTVRPSCLWDLESVKCLFSCNLSHLQKEDQYLIQGGLVNCLILKWPNVEDQMWDHRLKLLTAYIQELTSPLIASPLEFNLQYKPVIISMLQMLQYIIKLYKSEGIKSKKLLCLAFQKSVEHSLALFPIYVKDAEANAEILQFFLILLECLQQQVGITFTQIIVQTFMNVYTRQQLLVSLTQENGGGLQQLSQILDLVIQTPGLSASKLTPMAVNLCLQLCEPVLSDTASPSVQESLFQLVYSVLVHKWKYFFKTSTELIEMRTKEFLQLMRAMGQSLFLPNIDLFRQNLRNLERLNTRWNLYSEGIFKKELHSEFLTVLLNNLLNKSHPILNEEIAVAIFNLISADANGFYNGFLPRYLDSLKVLDPSQKSFLLENFTRESDMPSVIQNIFRLTNDLICYQLCNSSLPAGSVRL